MRYILLNKPYEVLTQFTDETGRQTLKDFVEVPGIYPVGRLDYDSEGLVLLTDDKQLQHRLSEPRFKVPKTYWVQVEGEPTPEALENLRRGVDLKTGYTSPADVALLPEAPELWERSKPVRFRASIPTSWLQIRISQGMNRQVRKMTAAVGYPTLRLVRAAIADMDLGELQPGQWRELTNTEVRLLTEDMAAQTAAAGTFKTPKTSEYWPGGIPPGGKKSSGSRGGFTPPGGPKAAGSKPNRPVGGPKAAGSKPGRPASSRADSTDKPAPRKPAGERPAGGRPAGAKPAGSRPAGGKSFGTKPSGGKPGSKPGSAGGRKGRG
ncbi:pseudouridine synthase [Hymenobacter actinosclerus]|uniref:Pseudouridine synthase n=1 Tax=Hymenobacter actinosclerus TaxID=82805 RepID=A0A1I0FF02_9BACT|nr:pseudouridine synthase [Hymenobacter actinosclerus]SET56580.1 ribosomal large subunit pseudouridine synthase E [Hymenobacter actinosclerus]